MATRITVNGVEYDSVDAMPADVRRMYDQLVSQFPDLADRGGSGVPEIIQQELGPLKISTTVRKKIVVNGRSYDDEASMPPEVLQVFEEAMLEARAHGRAVKRDDVRMSFRITPASGDTGMPAPIEPVSPEGRLRWALVLGAGAVFALALWLLSPRP